MGANGSTLDQGDNNRNEEKSQGDGHTHANGAKSGEAVGHQQHSRASKSSLKRHKHKKQQQSNSGASLTEESGREESTTGTSKNGTPNQSTVDLLAPTAGFTTSDLSHFVSFPPVATGLPEHHGQKPSIRYTPFPPQHSSGPTTTTPLTSHKMPQLMQIPSSFSSSTKPLLQESQRPQISHSPSSAGVGVDSSTLVVLEDYEAGDSRNLISLRQGDALHLVSADRTGTAFEVCLPDAHSESSASFFVPQQVVMKCRTLDAFPWYHGRVSRAEAERLLSSGIDGTFLVRESESSPGQLSVSLRSGQRVHHYRLTIDAGLWFLSPEWRFRTVPHLVRHHSRHPDGLACPLLYPAPRLSLRSRLPQTLSTSEFRELDRADLRVNRRLGGGQYGEVYEAIWLSRNMKVAVKTLRLDCAMGEREFLEEARVMTGLRHPNLVKLLGVVSRERPFYIVTEFMSYGNLQDFLRSRQTRPEAINILPVLPVLLRFAVDVSAAMQYLEARHFIHRDLAARNCLVTEDLQPGESGFAATSSTDRLVVKVGDFGLARLVGGPKGAPADAAYTANATGQFPIKWTAPEGLAYQRFSTKSDVWAFGILLWEIVTYGASPYPSVELSAVYGLLERGYRMEQPADCPSEVYQIMRDCWRWEPFERPTFQEVRVQLSNILESSEGSQSLGSNESDRFYEQLSKMPTASAVPAPRPPMETSSFQTFPVPDVERPRSGSLHSPSPSKAAANIARCRPHNFSFRPSGSSPNKPVAPPPENSVPLVVPPVPAHVTMPRSNSSDLGADLCPQPNVVAQAQQLGYVLRRGSADSSKHVTQDLLVTPNRGYGTAASCQKQGGVSSGGHPGVPPKPPVDISTRVTAELAEQMRRRRAIAEQEQPEKQQEAEKSGGQHSTNANNGNNRSQLKNNSDHGAPVTHRQQTYVAESGPSTTLVSGDGRPVAPVKPVFRKVQHAAGSSTGEYTAPTAASSRHFLRGPSPLQLRQGDRNSANVNWTWDDVHRLCQAVMADLVAEEQSAMSVSAMGRLPAANIISSPAAVSQLLDLASALDNLADSLPPRSRFQVRQLEHAIRTATASSAGAASTPISSAQIESVLNLIPPPSALTTSATASSSSLSNSNTPTTNANSSEAVSTSVNKAPNNSNDNTNTNTNNSSNSNANGNSNSNATSALPAGMLC